ncbi:hypothetical protein ACFO25_06350 [Paenactinomyces guangxiensis]|uniref:Uncharacterized protein n=1 Tax=Paenactinomyces guangxiensis TaxID=1490290 RepID=A0A7W2A797_9BACL|nr:hypothetical protein [Paenactinomyces guangxiensis]MBA4493325.1 hypothetical protein [Paenactinomyces guangxiensis]MBH8589824.1 hypothetical protein [Paenactinomyces guangxiensis]
MLADLFLLLECVFLALAVPINFILASFLDGKHKELFFKIIRFVTYPVALFSPLEIILRLFESLDLMLVHLFYTSMAITFIYGPIAIPYAFGSRGGLFKWEEPQKFAKKIFYPSGVVFLIFVVCGVALEFLDKYFN